MLITIVVLYIFSTPFPLHLLLSLQIPPSPYQHTSPLLPSAVLNASPASSTTLSTPFCFSCRLTSLCCYLIYTVTSTYDTHGSPPDPREDGENNPRVLSNGAHYKSGAESQPMTPPLISGLGSAMETCAYSGYRILKSPKYCTFLFLCHVRANIGTSVRFFLDTFMFDDRSK